MSNKFLQNASYYSIASIFTVVASLVSFPILTRVFEVSEYGLLGLVTATVPMLVSIGKIGLQHASLRHYAEIKSKTSKWSLDQFYTTVYGSLLLSALLTFVLWNVVIYLFGMDVLADELLCSLFAISSYIIIVRILESVMMNILRAKEEAGKYASYLIAKRAATLLTTLSVLLLYQVDLVLYIITLTATECAVFLIYASFHVPFASLRPRFFQTKLLLSMMAFGIPLFGQEIAGALITLTDRYVINFYVNAQQLGIYTSAYTLVDYAQGIITTAIVASALPIFLRLHSNEGEESAKAFIENALRTYIWAAVPIVFLIASAGEAAIAFLAGEKYSQGASVMPWIAVGMALHGSYAIVSAGIYLSNNTLKMFYTVAVIAILNLVLNLIFVPKFGITGAAITTLVSYCCSTVAYYQLSKKYMDFQVPWLSLLAALVSAVAMFFALELYAPQNTLLELVYKGAVGITLYAALLIVFDAHARQRVGEILKRST
ncbi:MAG: lipopolysaccharide biosynthesis protein [Pseudomonadales bacterium]